MGDCSYFLKIWIEELYVYVEGGSSYHKNAGTFPQIVENLPSFCLKSHFHLLGFIFYLLHCCV